MATVGKRTDLALVVLFAIAFVLVGIETTQAVLGATPYPLSIVALTVALGACMVRLHGARWAALFLLLILAVPFGAEFPGVLVGLPFGAYRYTDAAGPRLLGIVPVFILFAWIAIVYPVVVTTTLALARPLPILVLLDGGAATAWDVMVDPQAVRANFWTWQTPGPFYGIPLSNFVGWFLVVALVSLALRALLGRGLVGTRTASTALTLLPTVTLLLLATRYAMTAYVRGFPLAALVGALVLLPLVGWTLARGLAHPRPRKTATKAGAGNP